MSPQVVTRAIGWLREVLPEVSEETAKSGVCLYEALVRVVWLRRAIPSGYYTQMTSVETRVSLQLWLGLWCRRADDGCRTACLQVCTPAWARTGWDPPTPGLVDIRGHEGTMTCDVLTRAPQRNGEGTTGSSAVFSRALICCGYSLPWPQCFDLYAVNYLTVTQQQRDGDFMTITEVGLTPLVDAVVTDPTVPSCAWAQAQGLTAAV
eukprot:COSAG02_NODE_1224_length_13785_cov_22.936285_4_plen_207_part_00